MGGDSDGAQHSHALTGESRRGHHSGKLLASTQLWGATSWILLWVEFCLLKKIHGSPTTECDFWRQCLHKIQ